MFDQIASWKSIAVFGLVLAACIAATALKLPDPIQYVVMCAGAAALFATEGLRSQRTGRAPIGSIVPKPIPPNSHTVPPSDTPDLVKKGDSQ